MMQLCKARCARQASEAEDIVARQAADNVAGVDAKIAQAAATVAAPTK